RHQLEKARTILQTALTAAPDNFVIAEHVAELYLNLGLRSAALREMRVLDERRPAPLWLQARLALDYEQVGLLEDAARLAAAMVQAGSPDREQLELLTRIHERRHLRMELKTDYAALLRLNPQSPQLWSKLAHLQMEDGDLDHARESLAQLTALEPENAEAHRRLAL